MRGIDHLQNFILIILTLKQKTLIIIYYKDRLYDYKFLKKDMQLNHRKMKAYHMKKYPQIKKNLFKI